MEHLGPRLRAVVCREPLNSTLRTWVSTLLARYLGAAAEPCGAVFSLVEMTALCSRGVVPAVCAGPVSASSSACGVVVHVLLSILGGVKVSILGREYEFWKFKSGGSVEVKDAVVRHEAVGVLCSLACFPFGLLFVLRAVPGEGLPDPLTIGCCWPKGSVQERHTVPVPWSRGCADRQRRGAPGLRAPQPLLFWSGGAWGRRLPLLHRRKQGQLVHGGSLVLTFPEVAVGSLESHLFL